jgi:V/A-type H+-transporting ATPase subunit I
MPMKKYVFMTYNKEYDAFIHTLRDVGVVHVQEQNSASGSAELQDLIAKRKRVETSLEFFRKLYDDGLEMSDLLPAQSATEDECLLILKEVEAKQEERNRLLSENQIVRKEIDYLHVWGDFDYANIEKLQEAGYVVSFFTCPASAFNEEWKETYNATVVCYHQSVCYFVTVTKANETIHIEAENAKMPKADIKTLRELAKRTRKKIFDIEDGLKDKSLVVYRTLEEFDKTLQNQINLINVTAQTESKADNEIIWLEGWTTAEQSKKMETALDKKTYFYQELEIQEEDNVPIQLKNNAYTRLFEPITKLFSLPNYRELDPTPLFAPFFMLFFGLCFADAGYGLLILLGTTIAKANVSADLRPILSLAQWLGGTAVVIGLLVTGTLFGIELINTSLAPPHYFSQYALMQLALALGMIHIVFGKGVAAYKKQKQKGFKYSVAQWAWTIVIAIFLIIYAPTALGLLGEPLPIPSMSQTIEYVLFGIMAVCGLAILFYNAPDKSIFANFGSSLGTIYNTATGLLGDTLSYVRLFAIGLAGGILGGVFNMLAFDMTGELHILLRIPLVLLILLIGHSLNIALSLIASLVHPVRLVFVEYFKNSEYEGGGIEYAPFKKV